ncbi:MAG: phosphatidylglycerophosphatase A [Gammaproteobacteria bacterium]|nr:phosphatidylglycerophosphatase A [Gammaproteobacteria bacterium]
MTGQKQPSQIWRHPIHFLSFGFGSGLAQFAPGTFGTLAAIPVYLLLEPLGYMIFAIVTVALFLVGVVLCHTTALALGSHDHPAIVWDEIVGYLITMFMVPQGWEWVLAGFLLFRFFDILKPWPIRWIDRQVHGGFGIMLDDVLAGVFACLCLQGLVIWVL